MKPDLSRASMTLGQLRLMADALGIRGHRSMTRADLVDAIRAAEARRLEAEARERHAAHMDALRKIKVT